MRQLWDRGALTVNELMASLDRQVAYTTVLTLVRILESKGYVTHQLHPDGGRAYVYRAAVAEGATRKRHLKDLVDRLFAGKAESLVAGLIDDELLNREELEALKKRIDETLSPTNKRSRT